MFNRFFFSKWLRVSLFEKKNDNSHDTDNEKENDNLFNYTAQSRWLQATLNVNNLKQQRWIKKSTLSKF